MEARPCPRQNQLREIADQLINAGLRPHLTAKIGVECSRIVEAARRRLELGPSPGFIPPVQPDIGFQPLAFADSEIAADNAARWVGKAGNQTLRTIAFERLTHIRKHENFVLCLSKAAVQSLRLAASGAAGPAVHRGRQMPLL